MSRRKRKAGRPKGWRKADLDWLKGRERNLEELAQEQKRKARELSRRADEIRGTLVLYEKHVAELTAELESIPRDVRFAEARRSRIEQELSQVRADANAVQAKDRLKRRVKRLRWKIGELEEEIETDLSSETPATG